jgi:predicted lipoprotein with Yx(FWY)xxD motif
MNKLLTAALLSTILANAALAQSVSEKDGRLADASGRTLYTFDKDGANTSVCNGDCAVMWPPFVAAAGTTAKGDYALVARSDGAQQWSYKSKPLYYFSGDTQPGEAKGDGMGGAWHTVGTAAKRSAPSGYDAIRGSY